MLHRIFKWVYARRRSSYGDTYRKIERRSKDRDLIHYFEDFGGDGQNRTHSHWLRKRIIKFLAWVLFLTLAIWFSYQSYLGLLIYENWSVLGLLVIEQKVKVIVFFHKMKKTHKGIAKRFKVTGTGKVKFRKPGQRHLRRKKTTKQVRAGKQDQVLAEGMARRVIRALS